MASKYLLGLLSTFLVLLCRLSHTQELKSPCPSVFLYQEREDAVDRWYGLMNLISDVHIDGITLKLTLDNPALEFINLLGGVTTYNNKEYIISNRNFILTSNSSHLVRFYVNYDPKKPMPKLVSIQQNNKFVCPERLTVPSQVFVSVLVSPPGTKDIVPVTTERNRYNDVECGTIVAEATPLIIDGKMATVGTHPWHAAIFKIRSGEFRYACGGSLISEKYIVTTANCLKQGNKELAPSKFEIRLGVHNLSDQGLNMQTLQVADVVVHPLFNNKFNDIGLVKLKEPAKFNDFVRPVCLWEMDTDYKNIVNKTGTTVGWGITEAESSSENLKEATMFFVSYQDCLKEYPDFYVTRNIYCAGAVDGSTCTGDAGGGMVFLNESSGRKVYYLRGIVSYGRRICSTNYFEVHTDVTAYLDFIKANLQ